ncbi:Endo-type membrane-bound lytic murein transglycosylase A [Commensalibacter sp. Nvir]|uniref:lytic transglycosylase domain-containing protein n=1 Tax=Commensalibacter sp. Nvir TaxID=3069817 RepID=UPI002D2E57C2|nr:Endo-type membrane-bound lytic murein transglycosylase A [Commensalibacter sp. Nvir]
MKSNRQDYLQAIYLIVVLCSAFFPPIYGQDYNKENSKLLENLAPNFQAHSAFSSSPTNEKKSKLQEKINQYLYLLQPEEQSTAPYIKFLKENPDWPNQQVLFKRLQEALLNETSDSKIFHLCNTLSLDQYDALIFCGQHSIFTPHLVSNARKYWVKSILSEQQQQLFLALFSKYITTQEHWQRFQYLESRNALTSATQQIDLLNLKDQVLARAILALRKNDKQVDLSKLTQEQLNDASLIYANLIWLTQNNLPEQTYRYWIEKGLLAEKKSAQKRFWFARSNYIRDLLYKGHFRRALELSTPEFCSSDICSNEANFLSGWINLKKLNIPSNSISYFQSLTASRSIYTISKGYYWLGEALKSQDQHQAQNAWEKASYYPTTFYGQLSIAQIHDVSPEHVVFEPSLLVTLLPHYLSKISEPRWSFSTYEKFKNKELFQIADILVKQGDYRHARPFLLVNHKKQSILNQAMTAAYANELGLPEDAVYLSQNAAQQGKVLYKNGWPEPYKPRNPKLPIGLQLGVIRQESGFNPDIVSASNAYGLMQLLPSTAKQMAKELGLPPKMANPNNLIIPENNITLGSAYLVKLMKQFNGSVPYTLAAYNAGPRRIKQWLTQYTDDQNTIIDWIEFIPYPETRNYVQRVIENTMIYQTRIFR